MLNWDDYNVAEGDAPAAAPQQQAPVQPEVVNKALETLNQEETASAPVTDQVKAAIEILLPRPVVLERHQLVEICSAVNHRFLINRDSRCTHLKLFEARRSINVSYRFSRSFNLIRYRRRCCLFLIESF